MAAAAMEPLYIADATLGEACAVTHGQAKTMPRTQRLISTVEVLATRQAQGQGPEQHGHEQDNHQQQPGQQGRDTDLPTLPSPQVVADFIAKQVMPDPHLYVRIAHCVNRSLTGTEKRHLPLRKALSDRMAVWRQAKAELEREQAQPSRATERRQSHPAVSVAAGIVAAAPRSSSKKSAASVSRKRKKTAASYSSINSEGSISSLTSSSSSTLPDPRGIIDEALCRRSGRASKPVQRFLSPETNLDILDGTASSGSSDDDDDEEGATTTAATTTATTMGATTTTTPTLTRTGRWSSHVSDADVMDVADQLDDHDGDSDSGFFCSTSTQPLRKRHRNAASGPAFEPALLNNSLQQVPPHHRHHLAASPTVASKRRRTSSPPTTTTTATTTSMQVAPGFRNKQALASLQALNLDDIHNTIISDVDLATITPSLPRVSNVTPMAVDADFYDLVKADDNASFVSLSSLYPDTTAAAGAGEALAAVTTMATAGLSSCATLPYTATGYAANGGATASHAVAPMSPGALDPLPLLDMGEAEAHAPVWTADPMWSAPFALPNAAAAPAEAQLFNGTTPFGIDLGEGAQQQQHPKFALDSIGDAMPLMARPVV